MKDVSKKKTNQKTDHLVPFAFAFALQHPRPARWPMRRRALGQPEHRRGAERSPASRQPPAACPAPAPRLRIPVQQGARRTQLRVWMQSRVGIPGDEDEGGESQRLLSPSDAPQLAYRPRSPSRATSSCSDAKPAEEAGTSREAWGVGSACTRIPTPACPRGGGLRGEAASAWGDTPVWGCMTPTPRCSTPARPGAHSTGPAKAFGARGGRAALWRWGAV